MREEVGAVNTRAEYVNIVEKGPSMMTYFVEIQ